MSQSSQTHFKNLAEFAVKFLKCAWPHWEIMLQRMHHDEEPMPKQKYYKL